MNANDLPEPPAGEGLDEPSAACDLCLAIDPVASALVGARDRVRSFLRGFDLPEHTVFDVVLSLQEACKNAVRFSGSDRPIDVTVTMRAGEVAFVIRDHGVGFAPRPIDGCTTPDPGDPRGRGLFLMSCLMDDVEISRDRGAIVRARKVVYSINDPARRRAS